MDTTFQFAQHSRLEVVRLALEQYERRRTNKVRRRLAREIDLVETSLGLHSIHDAEPLERRISSRRASRRPSIPSVRVERAQAVEGDGETADWPIRQQRGPALLST